MSTATKAVSHYSLMIWHRGLRQLAPFDHASTYEDAVALLAAHDDANTERRGYPLLAEIWVVYRDCTAERVEE